MEKNKMVDCIASILVIIGGLNWGLVGIFNLNLVDKIFGSIPILAKIIYILVGIAAIYMLIGLTKCSCISKQNPQS